MARFSHLLLGLQAAACISLSTFASAAAPDASTRFAGYWQLAEPYQAALKTEDGAEPPLRPAARALLQERIAARAEGNSGDGVEVCLPPGIPRLMSQDMPFLMMVTPAKAYIVHQYQHTLRHIYLGETLPPAEERDFLFGGQSVGRWEGDTLVVETAGFNDQLRLDEAGLPQSPEAVVTERFRLVNDDLLEDQITITDPAHYSEPWTTRVRFKRAPAGTQLQEDICAVKLMNPVLRASVMEQSER